MEDFLLQNNCRCPCGKLLFKGEMIRGKIEIKCLRCGRFLVKGGLADFNSEDNWAFISNFKGRILRSDGLVRDILGLREEEILNKNVADFIYGEKQKQADQTICSRLRGKQYLKFDTFYKTKENKKLPVTVLYRLYARDRGGNFILRVVKNRVGDKKIDDKGKYYKVCDWTSEIDKRLNILYMDNNVEKFLGYQAEDVIGRSLVEFMPPEEKETQIRDAQTILPQGALEIDNRTKGKDGKYYRHKTYVVPIFDNMGEFVAYRAVNKFQGRLL